MIATGGLAHLVVPFTEEIEEVDDLLTLTGLRLLYELNCGVAMAVWQRTARLTDSWTLGPLRCPTACVLAPLAGIGNWFVRLQAKRYGAGMAVSEMVSSHAIHHRNEKTCSELLRIDPRERGRAGPVSIQLFGEDPEVMRSAAATRRARRAPT